MACGCIKKIFDLYVDFTDCKHIVIEDQSVWMSDLGYEKPDTINIKIKSELRGTEIEKDLYLNKRNIYDSIDLFNSSQIECLGDDIFCFTTYSCGHELKITRAYICTALCKIDTLTSRAKTVEDFKQISELKRMAEGILIDVKLGKVESAKELLKLLNRKLSHLTCGNCG